MKVLVSLLVLGVLIAGGIFTYYFVNDRMQKENYPLLDTRWQQTSGTFYGKTGFIIDFGESSFIATNGSTVIKGRYYSYSSSSLSLNPDGPYLYRSGIIAGNAIELEGASFIKVEKPKER